MTWPTRLQPGCAEPEQGSCAPVGAGPDLSCALGTIPAGGSATVGLTYTVPASTPAGTETIGVTVTSAVSDPDPGQRHGVRCDRRDRGTADPDPDTDTDSYADGDADGDRGPDNDADGRTHGDRHPDIPVRGRPPVVVDDDTRSDRHP